MNRVKKIKNSYLMLMYMKKNSRVKDAIMTEVDYINEIALKYYEAYTSYEKTGETSRSGYNEIKANMYKLIDQYYEEGKITDNSYGAICRSLEKFHDHFYYFAKYQY